MKTKSLTFFQFLSLIFVLSCSSASTATSGEIELMVYNVENLFDSVHTIENGVEKDDWTFLPKGTPGKDDACKKISYWRYKKQCFDTDWNDTLLKMKLDQIASVLTKNRKLPEILTLVEVEGPNVVGRLAKRLGYKEFHVSQSPDKRGIDLAIMYNPSKSIQFVSKREHEVKDIKRPTRDIFEVEMKLGGKPVHIFINHWPSQGNPPEARVAAAKVLKKRVLEIKKKSNHSVISLGDFNTIPTDYPHPFHTEITEERLLLDVHTMYKRDRSIDRKKKSKMPPGTYFYYKEMAWNVLDRIFVDESLIDGKGMDIVLSTYEIYAPKFITTTHEYNGKKAGYFKGSSVKRVPKSYDHSSKTPEKAGYSDHFPVSIKLKL
ncbi:MAG: endonuclease/exonuclease/phosphatase family protein [Bacteriovoracaceae bacterium]|nr:endonuclease/exonuclease/phosphatase family protein [Bacteriovoracaceae bacterium]